jgi:hypothetical protein
MVGQQAASAVASTTAPAAATGRAGESEVAGLAFISAETVSILADIP